MLPRLKSKHQRRVETFLVAGGHTLPARPVVPAQRIRALQSLMMLEEVLEAVDALQVVFRLPDGTALNLKQLTVECLDQTIDLAHVAKELADVRVTATGTMSLCGMIDEPIQEEVDENNILKFSTGIELDTNGKIVKTGRHPKPDLEHVLADQTMSQNIQETPELIGTERMNGTHPALVPKSSLITYGETSVNQAPVLSLLAQGCRICWPANVFLQGDPANKRIYFGHENFSDAPLSMGDQPLTPSGLVKAHELSGELIERHDTTDYSAELEIRITGLIGEAAMTLLSRDDLWAYAKWAWQQNIPLFKAGFDFCRHIAWPTVTAARKNAQVMHFRAPDKSELVTAYPMMKVKRMLNRTPLEVIHQDYLIADIMNDRLTLTGCYMGVEGDPLSETIEAHVTEVIAV